MYTITQTLSLIFGSCVILLFIILGLKKARIGVDSKLVISCLPYLFILPLIRSLVDAGIYKQSIFLVTPLIFFLPAVIILIIFMGCTKIGKQNLSFYVSGIGGLVLLLYLSSKVEIRNIYTPLVILEYTAISCGLLHILFTYKKFLPKLEECSPVYAHVFDALTIIVGSEIGYYEAHIIPNLIIAITKTPFSFLLLKIIITVLAILIINRVILDITTNRAFKGAIFVIGCFTGLRNLFRIIMMC